MVLAVAFGQGLFVLLYFAAVFLHELAHCVVAKRLFYHTEQIKLGIFGATLVGQFDNMSVVDTIKIALAGPLCNIVLAVCCLASWWMWPSIYPITHQFFVANVTMAVTNLLPLYPLDGGRIVFALVSKMNCRVIAVVKSAKTVASVVLFAIFVISLFTGDNLFSVGLFALCLLTVEVAPTGYTKSTFLWKRFEKVGMEKKTLVYQMDSTLSAVAKRIKGNYLYCLEIVDNQMKVVGVLNYQQLEHVIVTMPLTTKLSQLVATLPMKDS